MKIVIELTAKDAEILKKMTADRNRVARAMGYTSDDNSMAQMAAFVLRDELPVKAEFWRQQAELYSKTSAQKKSGAF